MEKEKKIKVLLAAGLFPPDIGGPARFAEALFKVLPEYGCEVRVVAYRDNEIPNPKFQTTNKSQIPNNKIFFINRRQNKVWRYIKYFWQVWKLRKWADVVYAFDIISVGLPCAIVKLLRPGTKLIVRLGGDHLYETALDRGWYEGTMKNYYREKRFNARERFIYFINQFVLKLSDKIIFNAEFLRGLYISERGIKKEKTTLTKNIRPVFNLSDIKMLESGERVKILYIGRLAAVRNLSGLLKAFKSIRTDLKNRVFLEIVGEGPEKNKLEGYLEKHNLGNRVRLMPKLPHDQAIGKMAECDILVVPSYTECNAHTIAEASRFNKLVIVTKESELYYSGIEGKGLVYIDPLDKEDFTKKLETAIDHAIARELGVIDGMRVIEEMTWEIGVVMEKHLGLFKEVIK